MSTELPQRLEEIIDDFAFLEGAEKLEYLLQLANELPPLPEWLHDKRDEMDEVHECMTPVFIFAENKADGLSYHFDIPAESPTVRGYGAILQQGTNGHPPETVLAIPDDFFRAMGLHQVLTGQRLNGIGAILAHMKTLAKNELA